MLSTRTCEQKHVWMAQMYIFYSLTHICRVVCLCTLGLNPHNHKNGLSTILNYCAIPWVLLVCGFVFSSTSWKLMNFQHTGSRHRHRPAKRWVDDGGDAAQITPFYGVTMSWIPGPCLNIKTVFSSYGDPHITWWDGRETVVSLTWESLYW